MKARKPLLAAVLICALALVACTIPAWVNTVEADAEIAVPIAASLIDVIDPALAPLVSLIESGFGALVKTLDTYKTSPTTSNLQAVQSAFEAVNSNVAQLESAAQIKDAATRTTVTQVAELLTQAVTEIAALVPASQSSSLKLQIPNSESRIPNSESRIPNPESRIPNSESRIPNSGSRIPNSGSRIPKGWKARDFKAQFNSIVKGDPRFKPLK